MNAAVVTAERRKEVRDAGRAWNAGGFLSAEQLVRVTSLYADPITRLGPGFAILSFALSAVAIAAVMGFFMVLFEPRADAALGVFFLAGAFGLAALTEVQRVGWKRVHCGSDDASALMGALFGVIGIVLSSGLSWNNAHFASLLFASTLTVCALAAWRWGDLPFFAIAGVALFGWLAQSPHGRALWILAAAGLTPIALGAGRGEGMSPSHRRGFSATLLIATLALYGAIHIYSWDHGWIEMGLERPQDLGSVRLLSILCTAILPPGLLLLGLRRREPLLIYSGLVLLALSLGTIRLYHEVMPLWTALILFGTACLAAAIGLRRWLRLGPGGEVWGLTADPLFENKNRTAAIQSVVSMASFTPSAQAPAQTDAFKGGGGSFGGGGATGEF